MKRNYLNQKGFSLLEIIVSIAIIAIIIVSISSLIISNQRIRKSMMAKENLFDEINNLYHIFSDSPREVINNIKTIYDEATEYVEGTDTITIRYNKEFHPSNNGSYLIECQLNWLIEVDYDILELILNINHDLNEMISNETKSRSIKVLKGD